MNQTPTIYQLCVNVTGHAYYKKRKSNLKHYLASYPQRIKPFFLLKSKEVQDRALKVTHQAEDLQSKKFLSGAEIRSEAYALLEKCNEHVDAMEQVVGQLFLCVP